MHLLRWLTCLGDYATLVTRRVVKLEKKVNTVRSYSLIVVVP